MLVLVVGAEEADLGERSSRSELGGVLGVRFENEPDEAKVKLEASELSMLAVGRLGEALRAKGRSGDMATPAERVCVDGDGQKG